MLIFLKSEIIYHRSTKVTHSLHVFVVFKIESTTKKKFEIFFPQRVTTIQVH